MATYYVNEVAFSLPPVDVIDRSVNILETVAPSGGEISILVQRARVPPGKSLRDLSTTRVGNAERSRAGYKVLFQRDTEVAGVAAIEVGARWRAEVGLIFAHEVHFSLGSIWVVVAGHGPLADQELTEEYLGHVLRTMRIREDREEAVVE